MHAKLVNIPIKMVSIPKAEASNNGKSSCVADRSFFIAAVTVGCSGNNRNC